MNRSLLIYDGKCSFCRIWIDYWRKLTGDRIDYAPSQEVGALYPQIPQEEFAKSVQLVRPDGSFFSGARAVCESLGLFYAAFPMEWMYRVVAGNRNFFYLLTKWTFGTQIEPARFALTQWIFIRALAMIYAIAFGSLIGQIRGLIGTNGISPVAEFLKQVSFFDVPSVFWMNASDPALVFVCWAGVAMAALLFVGFMERAALAILFVLYLSISSVGQDFLSFQWDALLLEVGFLAIFLGNLRIVVWLFRWLLFRLMFSSGAVKLLSHDPNWRNLTALSFHYWTQPLPNRIAWYMAQLPDWFQKVSTGWVLLVELIVPFFIFLPRRIRILGACILLALQVLIFLTGSYTFFNLLAMALCLFLFDDRDFEKWIPRRPGGGTDTVFEKCVVSLMAALVLTLSIFRIPTPFGIVNSYGLFAVMITERPEIVIEGSMDGEAWKPYSFRYKPGEVARAPCWAAPYQPRLDWQMWFAALGNYRENPWFVRFAVRLLEGSAEVKGLLEADPFDGRAPRYIRAELYDYRFTDSLERRRTGNWWKREGRGLYLPPVGLKNQ